MIVGPPDSIEHLLDPAVLETMAADAEALYGVPIVFSDATGRPLTPLPEGVEVCPNYAGGRDALPPECALCVRGRHPDTSFAKPCPVGFEDSVAPIRLKGRTIGFVACAHLLEAGQALRPLRAKLVSRVAAKEGADPAATAARLEARRARAKVVSAEKIALALRHIQRVASIVVEIAGERSALAARVARADESILELARLANVGTLVAGTVHDLRNAVHAMQLSLELIERRLSANGEQGVAVARDLKAVGGAVEFAHAVTDDLMRYLGHGEPRRSSIDIRGPVDLALRLVRPLASQARVTLRAQVPEALPPVGGTPNELAQLVLNLALNAVEATPAGGAVVVRLFAAPAEPKRLVLEVADSGAGIDPKVLPGLFDAFSSTKASATARGLGLFTVRRIAERHGARLEIDPGGDGRGARFKVAFPPVEVRTVAAPG